MVCRVANKSVTSWQQVCFVVVMEFGKRHDTTDTTTRANLLEICYGLVVYVAGSLPTYVYYGIGTIQKCNKNKNKNEHEHEVNRLQYTEKRLLKRQ